jgi:hypothetical protein
MIVWVLLACSPAGAGAVDLPRLELPLITSSGQSPDALMIKLVCDQLKLKADFDKVMSPEKIKGYKTLVIGIGGSVKGLGEAGIDTAEEIDRVNRLIQAARKQGTYVLAAHIGGHPRRGDLADPFIHGAAPKADFLIVRNDGNRDGLFTKIAKDNNIPIIYIEQTLEIRDILKSMFGL